MTHRPILLAALLPLAACVPPADQQATPSRAPAATAAGEPVSCIDTTRIESTRVWDDTTIDFEMRDNKTYRNTLDNRCPSLGFEQRFTYSTTITRLCSSDVITVLNSGGTRGASCGLGQFVPVTVAETR